MAEGVGLNLDLIDIIQGKYADLTPKQKQITDFMLENSESICYISLKELGNRTKSSEVTILRMCKALGFGDFLEMKKAFREHTKQVIKDLKGTDLFVPDISLANAGNKLHLLQQIGGKENERSRNFYKSLDYNLILQASESILNVDRVLIFGNEISALIGEFLYRRLVILGIPVELVHPEDIDHVRASLSHVGPRSQLIAITFPQYYEPLRNIVRFAEEKKAAIIAITDRMDSPVVTKNSLNFLCPSSTKLFYNSPTLPLAIVNLIASGIVVQMGPRYEQMIRETREIVHYIDDKAK